MKRRHRRIRIIALAAAALTLAGCTSIPTSGPVEVGLKDLKQVDQIYQYKPSGPIAGASQKDLVLGFVQAATSSVDDYATAREFLTSEYADQWDPNLGVLIDEGSRPYEADGEAAGILSLAAAAKVDASGDMLPVGPGPSMDMRFEFVRVGSEWRISSAPAGIILDSNTFTTIWSAHQLYFIGSGDVLVPETHWFLTRAALATEIIGALLEGPGERMREVVRSGFPPGTALATNSVPVVDGRARIDLTSNILEASPVALAEIRQQIKTSLQTVPGITGFDLYVEGTALRDTPSNEADAPHLVTGAGNQAVLVGDELGTLVNGEFTPMQGFGQTLGELHPTAISLAPDDRAAAVLNDQGVSRVDDAGTTLVDGRSGLLEPGIDPQGFLWSTAVASPELLLAAAPGGNPVQVPAPWLKGRSPVAVRVSVDGSRVAALVASGDGSQVLVAGIVRDERGVPLRTTEEADTKLWASGAPLDLDWVGQLRFAALTKVGTAGKVTLGGIGLFGIEQTSVPGGAHISGGGGRTNLRVLGGDGDLFAPQGSGWQRSENDIEVLAKRG